MLWPATVISSTLFSMSPNIPVSNFFTQWDRLGVMQLSINVSTEIKKNYRVSKSHWCSQDYMRRIPFKYTCDRNWEFLLLFLFCPFTICFGPQGPSSGEIQHHLYILKVLSIPQRIRIFKIYKRCCISLEDGPWGPKHIVNGQNKNNNNKNSRLR
jgi:hypothetical protein